ncbi:MAG TPA: hypothetical protein VKG25_08540 [Bryobacteraceae bacterium]|nr:hypothetical protein [Bryobacteraceae bacterium]
MANDVNNPSTELHDACKIEKTVSYRVDCGRRISNHRDLRPGAGLLPPSIHVGGGGVNSYFSGALTALTSSLLAAYLRSQPDRMMEDGRWTSSGKVFDNELNAALGKMNPDPERTPWFHFLYKMPPAMEVRTKSWISVRYYHDSRLSSSPEYRVSNQAGQ